MEVMVSQLVCQSLVLKYYEIKSHVHIISVSCAHDLKNTNLQKYGTEVLDLCF